MSANPGALPGWFQRRADEDEPAESVQRASEEATNSPAASQSQSQSTTGGGKDEQTPVVVWEAANRMEAEIVAGRLHSEGIPAIIRGEALGAIYGLTTGTLAAATVLVPALLAEKANEILASSVEWDEADAGDSPESDHAGNDHAQNDQQRDG
jgi:hypothetical protein